MSHVVRSAALIAALIVSSLLAAPAGADPSPAPLAPGATVVDIPNYGSPVYIVAQNQFNFSSPSGPSGVLIEDIFTPYTGVAAPGTYIADPYGPDGIVFAYQLTLSSDTIAEVSIPGFGTYDTSVKVCDLAICLLGTGTVPTSASRSADGGTVDYDFANPILSSSGFDIYTNARGYADPAQIELIDPNGNVSTIDGFFGPAGPIPEPSAWEAMLLGVGVLGGAMRSSRRAGRPSSIS
jgi:hypothetical protein